MKKIIISALIASLTIIFTSCSKDDNSPGNETNGRTTAIFNPDVTYGILTDRDGNRYKTVTIGTQTWMAENLRTTKYNDGTPIPKVTVKSEWEGLTSDAYCNYNNTFDIDTIATFGRLYNWYTVNTGKLAPEGWHVPTDAEWTTLTDHLGGVDIAGGKIKEPGITHWVTPNTGATNISGFTALPGGFREYYGGFNDIGEYGIWWTDTEKDIDNTWYRDLYFNIQGLYRNSYYKKSGFSVRCVRD